ncbi:MAG: hypothetical protein ACKVU2_13625 [Saprospiraceae bacterium]
MYPKKTFQFLLAISILAAAGCRKDEREFIPYTPVQENLDLLLEKVPDASTNSVFQFGGNVVPDTTLTSTSGVRVFLVDTEKLFADENGVAVPCSTCPALRIEVTTALRKSDFVAHRLPTSTYPDPKMLESVGAVNIRVFCGTNELRLLPNRYLKVQMPAPTDAHADLRTFVGVLDSEKNVAGWFNTGESAFLAQWPLPNSGAQQSGYELIVRQTGWSNCAQALTEPSSTFCVKLPPQFTALNARVFLVFQNKNAIAELKGDDTSSTFCFSGAPLGYPVNVVVVGKTGAQYWLANQFTEVGTNVELTVAPLPLSEQDLINFLKSL